MTVSEFEVNDGYECPTCSKVLNTSVGLKQHHTKVHGESLVRTEECVWCGDEFKARPSQEGRFCSRECFGKHRTENGVEARKRRVTITCSNCGKDFETCRSRQDEKKYCSNECYYADSDREFIDCEVCGDTFKVHGKYTDDARFCSQDCYGVWLSRNNSGSDSQHWKGGKMEHDTYGPGWGQRKRDTVRSRDGYECVDCGTTQAEHMKEHDMALHVHHLVSPRESTNPAIHNATRNLETLCISCHLGEKH